MSFREFKNFVLFVSVFFVCFLSFVFAVSADYQVKVIYFQPNDSQDRSEWLDLDSILKSVQGTYQSEMERHGFFGKIFRLETGPNDQVIIYKVKGSHNKGHYSGDTLPIVIEELEKKGYNNRQSIYVVVMAGMEALWHNFAGGIATAKPDGGSTGNSDYFGYCVSVETSREQVEDIIRHELGHTFGLSHIALYDPNDYIMGSGNKLAFHEARWLSRNHYFNRTWTHNIAPDLIEFHGAELFEDEKIKFRADVSDKNGLFQAYAVVNTNVVGWIFFDENVTDTTADFADISRKHLKDGHQIYFKLMDADGNWRLHHPKTYTLPNLPAVVQDKQFPDCVLCDLGGFQEHLEGEINDILTIKESINLTFKGESFDTLKAANSPNEWDGWVIGEWEKLPGFSVPDKSSGVANYYFDFPEMEDLSHWMYSSAPSRIEYNLKDQEYNYFGAYFIMPQPCTTGMEFIARANFDVVYAKKMYLLDYGTYIEFEIPEDTELLTLKIGTLGSQDCDQFVLGEPKLFTKIKLDTQIDADVNNDGSIDLSDVTLVKNAIKVSGKYDTDINNDGITDSVDLMIVKAKAMESIAAAAPRKPKVKITTWGALKKR